MNLVVISIISGGQTGVDRGALDAALELGLRCGGYCPKGRLAEDGVIPPNYPLVELPDSGYPERTRRNVVESDATLVLKRFEPSRGTQLTLRLLQESKKEFVVFVVDACIGGVVGAEDRLVSNVRQFLDQCQTKFGRAWVLNVAGNRESGCPGIQELTRRVLVRALV